MKLESFYSLFSGGLSGNLGVFLSCLLLLLIPNLCLIIKALRLKFYFLKFLQYPGLLTFAFIIFVFMMRQDKWLDLKWRNNFFEFVMAMSFFTNLLSLILIRRFNSKLLKLIPISFVLGMLLQIIY
jgi:hypothetical protein